MSKKKCVSFILAFCMLFSSVIPHIAADAAGSAAEEQDARSQEEVVINAAEYGVAAEGLKDNAQAIQAAIEAAKEASESAGGKQVILDFPKGEYHIYPDRAYERELYISNTVGVNSSYKMKKIGFLFEDTQNITVRGNGSLFMFHGKMTTFTTIRSENIRFEDYAFDFYVPTVVDITAESVDRNAKTAVIYVPECYNYSIRGTTVTWKSDVSPYTGREYWSGQNSIGGYTQRNSLKTGKTWRGNTGVNPIFQNVNGIEDLGGHRLKFSYSNMNSELEAGLCCQMRTTVRDHAGMFFWQSKDVVLEDIDIHFLHGFGIVGQHSENITFNNVDFDPPEGSGRTTAGYADFIQISGCKGKVTMNGCTFKNPHDDPINIHGTYNQIVEKIADNKYKVRYMHNETAGFPNFFVGDEVEFVSKATLLPIEGARAKVTEVQGPAGDSSTSASGSMTDIIITLDKNITLGSGTFAVENITWTPEVEISNCVFEETPTRGILVTTRKPVVIRNNIIDGMGMASIYISCDAQGWYESGPVKDVLIEGNTFYRPTSSAAAIFIEPTNGTVGGQVHENITIRNNTFHMLNGQVLNAKCVKGLKFENNKIYRYEPNVSVSLTAPTALMVNDKAQLSGSATGASLTSNLYAFNGCKEVSISGNNYDGGLKLGGSMSNMDASDVTQGSGENITFSGTATTLEPTGGISYEVKDKDVVSINYNGEITGLKTGTTKVRAYTIVGGKKYVSEWKEITVSESVSASLTISSADDVEVTQTYDQAIQYTAVKSDASIGGDVSWSVVDAATGAETDCATIDAKTGVLTTVSDGAVEVIARVGVLEARKLLVINKGNWLKNSQMSFMNESLPDRTIGADGKVTIYSVAGGLWANNATNRVTNMYRINLSDIAPDATNDTRVTAIVKMNGKPQSNWEEAGLYFFKDADNYVAIERKASAGACLGTKLVTEANRNANEDLAASASNNDVEWLKLVKEGDTFTAYRSLDAEYSDSMTWDQCVNGSTTSKTNTSLGTAFGICVAAYSTAGASNRAFTFSDLKVQIGNGELTDIPLSVRNRAPGIEAGSSSYADGKLNAAAGTFTDPDGHAQGDTLVRWEAADTQDGVYRLTNLNGAQNVNASSLAGKFAKAVIVPKDSQGLYGAPVRTAAVQVGTDASNMPTAVSISGDTTINVHGTAKQYTANLTPAGANPMVTWRALDPVSGNDADCASIDASGRLTASADGVVELQVVTANGLEARKLVVINKGGKTPELEVVDLNENGGNWSITESGSVRIKAMSQGLWDTQKASNIFLKSPGKDLTNVEATLKMRGVTNSGYQEAGLIFYKNDDNYTAVERKHGGGSPKLKLQNEVNRAPSETGNVTSPSQEDIWFKLKKTGNTLEGFYSLDGSTWNTVANSVTNANLGADFKIGFMAADGSGSRKEFEFLELTIDGVNIPLAADNHAPSASGASCAYDAEAGRLTAALTGFTDADSDTERGSLVKWMAAETQNGAYELVPGLVGTNIVPSAALEGKYVKAVIVPRDEHGLYGAPVTAATAISMSNVQQFKACESALASASITNVDGMDTFNSSVKHYMGTATTEHNTATAVFTAKDEAATIEVSLNGKTLTAQDGEYEINFASGRNVLLAKVTAEDEVTHTEYRFVVSRTGDSNANLTGITLNGDAVDMDSSEFTSENPYTYEMDRGASSLPVVVTSASDKATVTISANGETVNGKEGAVKLVPGMNDVVILVKPETLVPERCYYLRVSAPSNTNANLESLSFSASGHNREVTLSERFSAAVQSYTGRTNADEVTITMAAQEQNAEIELFIGETSQGTGTGTFSKAIQMKAGSNVVKVKVTAPDGVTEKEYTLNIVGDGYTYIDFDSTSTTGYGTLRKDASIDGNPIRLRMEDGTVRTFEKGVGGHAKMELIYDLEGRGFNWFNAYLGVDQESTGAAGTINYMVYLDGELIDDGGGKDNIFRNTTPAVFLDFSVEGARTLRIVVEDGGNGIGNDHVSVGDAKFTVPMTDAAEMHMVKYQADPKEWGIVNAQTEAKKTINGLIGVTDGEDVILTATARDGYQFQGWYKGEEKVSDNLALTVTGIQADAEYTAKYKEDGTVDPPVVDPDVEQAKKDLRNAIETAEGKDYALYTEDSVAAFMAVVNAAKEVLGNEEATLEELQEAKKSISDAEKDVLVLKDSSVKPDPEVEAAKNELNTAIEAAGNKDLTPYTDESAEEFRKIVESAKAVLQNPDATLEELQEAKKSIGDAEKNVLVLKQGGQESPKIDKNTLSAKIDEASKVDTSGATQAQIDKFHAALEEAKKVLQDENATQAQVDAALANLAKAQEELKKVQPTPIPQPDVPGLNTTFEIKGYCYKVTKADAKNKNGTVTLTKVKGKKKKIAVPATVKYKGYKFRVTAIGKNACQKNTKLTKLTIASSVKNIGAKAFFKCKKLKSVVFKGTKAPKVGKQAFKSIHAKCVVYVPKKTSAKQLRTFKKRMKLGRKATFRKLKK
ncbi:NPCBM/NEW2 domain-containing protein [Lachnospiraceae bacterium 46-15]